MTINCAERGLLLLRVRDEIRMTIAAYQTLYESSVAFGMRKALQAEQGKTDMKNQVSSVLAIVISSNYILNVTVRGSTTGLCRDIKLFPFAIISVPISTLSVSIQSPLLLPHLRNMVDMRSHVCMYEMFPQFIHMMD